MSKSFRDWLAEGEQLFSTALGEYNALEGQIEALEQQLVTKRAEVNEIARVIGKPPVESSRRVSAQLVDVAAMSGVNGGAVPAGQVARALSGRGPIVARA